MIFFKKFLSKLYFKICTDKSTNRFSIEEKGSALSALLQRITDFDLTVRVLQTRRFARPISPTFLDHPDGNRLLIIAPHQDDDIIGCGGLILHAVREKKEIIPIYLSDGKNHIPGYLLEEVPKIRKKEAIDVWNTIGGIKPIFLDIPNKNFEVNEENAKKIYHSLRKYKPDSLFIPFFLEDSDIHRKSNHLLLLANKFGPLPNLKVWAYQTSTMICPNVGIEISDVFDKKIELMKMWESQNTVFNYAHYTKGLNIYNGFFLKDKKNKSPHVELFFVVSLEEYTGLLDSYFKKNALQTIYGNRKKYF
jgi:LmbE family N-acetylglucosaminyl deacetylase